LAYWRLATDIDVEPGMARAVRTQGFVAGLSSIDVERLTFRAHPSIAAIPRDEWQRILPGEPESWDFYRAIEDAPPPGFRLGVVSAHLGNHLVAAAPLFQVAYRIDTPFQGRARTLGDWLHERLPRLVSFPVIGLGSPMSDTCALGFAPELSAADCAAVFDGLLGALFAQSHAHKSALIAVKSLDATAEMLEATLHRHGYRRVTSVPLVMLDLTARTLEEYLDDLPEKTGSYLRRKLRGAREVRIEYRASVNGLEGRLHQLFENTLMQSRVDYGDFEKLNPAYFSRVVHGLGQQAKLMLCWRGNELLSFQLFLVGRDRVLAKQIGMKYPEAREFNLYFVNWLKLIEFAIEHRIPCVEMGATTYHTKLLFGGHLERRWLHFRFRGTIANRLLKPAAPLFDFERNDPELQRLDPDVKREMGPRMSSQARRFARHT
jgi:predicted N-acyltransferase